MAGYAPKQDSLYKRNRNSLFDPPTAPSLAPKQTLAEFSKPELNVSRSQKIRLLVEFPIQQNETNTNDISMYFKKLMTLLFAVDKKMVLLNWDDSTQNPITKAVDIKPSKEEISQECEC